MAFTFPPGPTDLATVSNPATGATYQWRAQFSKWVLTATSATDQIGARIDDLETDVEELQGDIERIDDKIDEEIEVRNDLINQAQGRNNAQDAAIAELDARVDSISENIGVLEFKGVFTYTLERSEAACNALRCLLHC